MKVNFHLTTAAASNNVAAKIREHTRLSCIAWCMRRMGHHVTTVGGADDYRGTERFQFFRDLDCAEDTSAVTVYPAESMRGRDRMIDVGIKCSVGCQNDAWYLGHCRVLVAHEYDDSLGDRPNLLPVPFLCADTLIEAFLKDGLMEAYLKNDYQAIRAKYGSTTWHRQLLGMNACGWRHRKVFCENAPEWADVRFYDTPNMTPTEHLTWLSGFKGALELKGDTPKTNLMSTLALMGIPIVHPPMERRVTPPLDESNSIVFQSWEQVESILRDDAHLERIIDKATRDYCESWSPAGQARLIVEHLVAGRA